MNLILFVFSLTFSFTFIFPSLLVAEEASTSTASPNSFRDQQRVFLDLEDGDAIPIFNFPGMTLPECQKKKGCVVTGVLNNDSTVKVVGDTRLVQVKDPYTHKMVTEEYAEVELSYQEKVAAKPGKALKSGKVFTWETRMRQGWVDVSYLRDVKPIKFFGLNIYSPDPPAPPPQVRCPPLVQKPKSIETLARALPNSASQTVADKLMGSVGKCVNYNPRWNFGKSEVVYDQVILPSLPSPPQIKGMKITRKQLADIDAVARTLFAEVGSCFKKGLRFPMSVARIVSNRNGAPEEEKERDYIQGQHSSQKGDLGKIATSPYQFQVWLFDKKKFDNNKDNSGAFRQALCPPRSQKAKQYNGTLPDLNQVNIWKNSVRIATELVLFPNRFHERTKELKNYKHYTSEIPFYPNHFNEITGIKLEGQELNNPKCVRIWSKKGTSNALNDLLSIPQFDEEEQFGDERTNLSVSRI